MKRDLAGTGILASALLLMGVAPAAAQVSADIQVSWRWSQDGWRSSGPVVDGYVRWSDAPDDRGVRHDRAPARGRMRPGRGPAFRVPPGHMPPAGMCRVWFVGRPPGLQPPPAPCGRLFRSYIRPDVVILHSPVRYERDWRPRSARDRDRWDDDRWDDDRWKDRDRDRRHDRGRRGPGRRGPS